MKTEKYIHHNVTVTVNSELKGRHKEICLCHRCVHFQPNTEANCPIAQKNYEMDVQYNLVTPVIECPYFNTTLDVVDKLPSLELEDFVDEIGEDLKKHFKAQRSRWNYEWVRRSREGQDERFKSWLVSKFIFDPMEGTPGWAEKGVRPDYLKIMGECVIALVREKYL